MTEAPSKAGLKALRWLADHGGMAAPDRYGHLVARGDRSSYQPQTWLRLFISGHVCGHIAAGHVGITIEGLKAIHK